MKRATTALMTGAAIAGAGALCAGAATVALIRGVSKIGSRRLQGKVVLITGGSRGLGLALAEEFGRRGARLVLTARDPMELDRARSLLMKRGAATDGDIVVIPADLRRMEDVERLIEQATEALGPIDILVNNAGVITVGPVENQSAQDFYDVMSSNFFTGLHCSLAVLPQMLRRRSGTIVNITSIGGKIAVPHLLPYTASKFAAVGLSQGLNAELRSKGIHVVTVCPGLMRTGSHLQALFTGDAEREYRWFSFSASLPGATTSAAAAARRIVRAVLLKESEIAITPQAIVAARSASLVPEAIALAMSITNRFLPSPVQESREARPGAHFRGAEFKPVAAIGNAAARRYNQTAT